LHGFPDAWRGWRRQMKAVAEAGYRAIALDMRGYGDSSILEEPLAYGTTIGGLRNGRGRNVVHLCFFPAPRQIWSICLSSPAG
jgi:pimeloyl-ACP methyl ester carboxylesterase